MTEKPSRKSVKDNYNYTPYFPVYLATLGATVLSYTPPWFYEPILYIISYVLDTIREIQN